jgi:hypothetical protein
MHGNMRNAYEISVGKFDRLRQLRRTRRRRKDSIEMNLK